MLTTQAEKDYQDAARRYQQARTAWRNTATIASNRRMQDAHAEMVRTEKAAMKEGR